MIRDDVDRILAYEASMNRVSADEPEFLFNLLTNYGLLPEEFDEVFPTRHHAVLALYEAESRANRGLAPLAARPGLDADPITMDTAYTVARRVALVYDYGENDLAAFKRNLLASGFTDEMIRDAIGGTQGLRDLLRDLWRDVTHARESMLRRWAAEAKMRA